MTGITLQHLLLVVWGAALVTAFDYCSISKTHELCGPQGINHKNCHGTIKPHQPKDSLPFGVSKTDADYIVMKHNELRGKVARGDTMKQPKAANMMAMQWDDELASIAQAWANKCIYTQDCTCDCYSCGTYGCDYGCRDVKDESFKVGQNIYRHVDRGYSHGKNVSWEYPLLGWYKQRENMVPRTINSNIDEWYGGSWPEYSQLMWAKSYKVGCGYIMWEDMGTDNYHRYFSFYVCNYAPGGNELEVKKPVYIRGPTASKCPAGTTANSETGLCDGTPANPNN